MERAYPLQDQNLQGRPTPSGRLLQPTSQSVPDAHLPQGTGTKFSVVRSNTKKTDNRSPAGALERDPDHELVAACRGGNRQAFQALALRHKDRLYTLATRLLEDHGEAEDVTQETLLRAYQNIEEFRGDARFTTWLYRICYNLCLSCLEGKKHQSMEEAGPDELPDLGEQLPDQLIASERRDVVNRALSRMTPAFREVIVLHYTGQLLYEEIATLLALPVGTVRSRLHRGRAELKELLRSYFQQEG
jgi:RNA polymerase sigma-70 factor (ECF subfamily)